MKEFKDKLDKKFGSLSTIINNHTNQMHNTTTTIITNYITKSQRAPHNDSHEFLQSSIHMQGIMNGLSITALEMLHRTAPTTNITRTPYNCFTFTTTGSHASKATHKCTIKDPIHLMNNTHITSHKCHSIIYIVSYYYYIIKSSHIHLFS